MVLVLSSFSTSLPTHKLNKRSQPISNRPQSSEQLPLEQYRVRIEDVYQRAADLHSATVDAINSMGLPHATKQYWNGTRFLEAPEVTEDNINELKWEPVAAMTSHRALITDMYFHIRRCHSIGQIGQQSLANGRTLRSWLVQISNDLFHMKIALNPFSHQQSQNGHDEMVRFSEYFLNFEASYTYEEYRAYTIMKDNTILMGYLKDLYSAVLYTQQNS